VESTTGYGSLILRIEPDSHVPPYEQIRSQIATMAASGVLREGARLPAIRQLASDLGLAGGTVARAYRELEQGGIISTRGRHGTFVEKMSPTAKVGRELDDAARSFMTRALQLGVDSGQAVESVRRAFEQIPASAGSSERG
jgi:DNA-binding transcriptional regulator YhcF (GntR family)